MLVIVCIKVKKKCTYCISLAVEVFCYPGWSLNCDDSDINTDVVGDNLIGIKTRNHFGIFLVHNVGHLCLSKLSYFSQTLDVPLVPKPSLYLFT